MKKENRIDDVEVKKANIAHHALEAELFERAHPEGSSVYEISEVTRSMVFIAENSDTQDLCVDIGCGTGFATNFELSLYKTVIATDISRQMLKVVKRRLGHFDSLNLVNCDAEFLPLKEEIADLISISSVLHHLPKPFISLKKISSILKQDGFLYIVRDPSFRRMRNVFDFFGKMIRNFTKLLRRLHLFSSDPYATSIIIKGSSYSKVDVHYQTGFHVKHLAEFLNSNSFDVLSQYSYHWIYPSSNKGLLAYLLAKGNFFIERIPLSNRFGRFISIIARKR
jgi:ubiquinone/menaquinone biosynthesis C-methylase UbiE